VYWLACWIAAILIAAGILVWLYSLRRTKTPLGLVIAFWGVVVWLAGFAIRRLLAGR
jgi:hypothetical protein